MRAVQVPVVRRTLKYWDWGVLAGVGGGERGESRPQRPGLEMRRMVDAIGDKEWKRTWQARTDLNFVFKLL